MSEAPLLIAQIDPPHLTEGGDWYYRTHAPGRMMAELDGVYVVNFDNIHHAKLPLLEQADVVVLNSVCDPDLLPLMRARKQRKQITVYEVNDDVAAIPSWNSVYAYFKVPQNVMLHHRMAKTAEANQYSATELFRLYGYLTDIGAVFTNQFLRPMGKAPRPASAQVVIGWGGSDGHLEDMKAVAPALIQFLKERPHVVLSLMCSPTIAREFQAVPEAQKRVRLPGTIEAYYAFVETLDIGIAPLQDAGFNRSRSDVKFLEYAGSGVAPVVQRLVPYLESVQDGVTGRFFGSAAELVQVLGQLVDQPAERHRIATEAQAYVARDRQLKDHVGVRVQFYRELLRAIGSEARQASTIETTLGSVERAEGAVREGRHLRLRPTTFERLLHDGLMDLQRPGGTPDGVRRFREAMRIHPDSYMPHLMLGASIDEGKEPLEKALALWPSSLQAKMALGIYWEKAGKPGSAVEQYLSAMDVFPNYEPAYLRAIPVLKTLGHAREAQSLEVELTRLLAQIDPGQHRPSTVS